jgi:hypothetical protein
MRKNPRSKPGQTPQERVCACGVCNVTFVVGFSNRKQRWAKGCPQKRQRQYAQSAAARARAVALERAGAPVVPKLRESSSERRTALEAVRQKRFICKICFNLPHARAKKGCVLCGLPYAP